MPKKTGLKHFKQYLEMLNKLATERYIGHSKIIRYDSGLPVYSNLMPPLLSGPSANSEVNQMIRSFQHRPLPDLVNIALTDVCNAKCEHCSFYTDLDDPTKDALSVEELKNLIRQCQDLGTSIIGFVGGEPLMHPHWREVFESIDKMKSHVVVFTNAWFLKESAADLKAAGVGGVYVSLDASQAEEHDRKRGLKGLFDKAMEGIKAAIKANLTVGISCCIDKQGFENGELDKIIELGRQKGVHEVLVFDAVPVGRFCSRDDLRGQQAWVAEMIEHVRTTYNQDNNYPGILMYSYLSSHMSLGCEGATCYFYVSPYGEICPCDFYHEKFGNVREERLYTIWDRMTKKLGANGSNWNGCWAKQRQITNSDNL